MRTDYGMFFLVCIAALVVLAFFCLVRSVLGPRLTDRIVAVNMAGTMTIAIIALLAVYLNESSLLDICLLFAAMSFIAVIVLTKIYHGIYNEMKAEAYRESAGKASPAKPEKEADVPVRHEAETEG